MRDDVQYICKLHWPRYNYTDDLWKHKPVQEGSAERVQVSGTGLPYCFQSVLCRVARGSQLKR
jgi:hypothetical protein